jgi:hypothetical protein
VLGVAFIGVENAFSPFRSEVEARVAHSDAPGRSERSGEPEWSLRNGGCVAGLPCEDGNEGSGGNQEESLGWNDGMEAEAYRAPGLYGTRYTMLGRTAGSVVPSCVFGVRNLRGMAKGEQDARRGSVFDL